MKQALVGLLVTGCLLLAGTRSLTAADPLDQAETRARYSFRKEHDPNGIGKFYMGREIAHVMGFLGAPWLERDSREEEERLTLLVRSLKLKPGMVVADIGAGSGVISMLMAREIEPEGSVLAVDIQQEMLDRLKKKCEDAGVMNVVPVKGAMKSPNLKPASVDLIVMVDVYHEFEFPYEMTLELAKALKPGGRIAWVEYRLEDPTVPIKLVHKMTEKQVRLEASQPEFGLKFVETIGVLPRQHIVIFQKSDTSEK
jgi:ubiquinone/menaquinone biosynthesis C-methylase UbiE